MIKSLLLYGVSGSTKTSQAYHMVRYILSKPENKGKHFRLIHSDGGGYRPFEQSGMVERKEVKVFDYSYREYALANWRWLAEGYWPVDIKNPTSGEVTYGYFNKEEICRRAGWNEKVAGYIIEGLSSCSSALEAHCSNQEEGIGFKESIHFEEQGEHISGLTQGHYSLVQKELYQTYMRGFRTLPVEWLICTALVGKGEDKRNNETVYGPQASGNALTPKIPAWFESVFHLEAIQVMRDGQEREQMVAWFRKHPDRKTGTDYMAKTSILPDKYPELMKEYPNGYVPLGFKRGLDVYLSTLEKLGI